MQSIVIESRFMVTRQGYDRELLEGGIIKGYEKLWRLQDNVHYLDFGNAFVSVY